MSPGLCFIITGQNPKASLLDHNKKMKKAARFGFSNLSNTPLLSAPKAAAIFFYRASRPELQNARQKLTPSHDEERDRFLFWIVLCPESNRSIGKRGRCLCIFIVGRFLSKQDTFALTLEANVLAETEQSCIQFDSKKTYSISQIKYSCQAGNAISYFQK